MKRGCFITATNTGRGKTVFTAGLTLWLRENGRRVIPMKPIQTGIGNTLHPSDLTFILKITGMNPPPNIKELMQPFSYQNPCSPHLAAEREQRDYPSLNTITSCVKTLLKEHEIVLVEGAGGLLVPIDRNKKLYVIDLIKELGFPVILVTQNALGTLNETCLSIEALQKRKIPLEGFLFNERTLSDDYISKDNPTTITAYTGVQCLGQLPYMKPVNRKKLLHAFQHLSKIHTIFDKTSHE